MFDPTAFDNMKVVLEGALYDKDLDKQIVITDRNDIVNLAKLSRSFDLMFQLADAEETHARIVLDARLQNLASELLPGHFSSGEEGCTVKLEFTFIHKNELDYFSTIAEMFKRIWGKDRKISQAATIRPFDKNDTICNTITVQFDRIITEDQMDDLVDMIDYMLVTLREVRELIIS